MLSKKMRLNKKLFNEVFKFGTNYHSNFLSAKILKLKEGDETMFSFVVSKKVSKKAFERVSFRRKGYSILKNIDNIKPSFGCIFFIKKNIENINFKELEKEIIFLLKKSKII